MKSLAFIPSLFIENDLYLGSFDSINCEKGDFPFFLLFLSNLLYTVDRSWLFVKLIDKLTFDEFLLFSKRVVSFLSGLKFIFLRIIKVCGYIDFMFWISKLFIFMNFHFCNIFIYFFIF